MHCESVPISLLKSRVLSWLLHGRDLAASGMGLRDHVTAALMWDLWAIHNTLFASPLLLQLITSQQNGNSRVRIEALLPVVILYPWPL
jgi:hypothetical protein